MSKLIVNKPCSNCNSPLKSVDCIYYDYNAQISPGHKHNSHKLIGKAICVKNCETYTSVYEICDCGWPNANTHHTADSDYEVLDSIVQPIDMTQVQAVPITKKIFGTCLRCKADIVSYNMYGGKCINGHAEFYNIVTDGHTKIKRPGNLHGTRIVASPCAACDGEIIAISYIYTDANVKYESCADWSMCKINNNALKASCLCINNHITDTTVKEVCMCRLCSINKPVNHAVTFKTFVDTPCTDCKYIEPESIELIAPTISVRQLTSRHSHDDPVAKAFVVCKCGCGSIQTLRQQCSCGFDSNNVKPVEPKPIIEPVKKHHTSFMTNICLLCCRETKTDDVACGVHSEYTEVQVTCTKGHKTQQQVFSKCACGFKSNGYVDKPEVIVAPVLTAIPRDSCIICDKTIIHINYQKPPTNSVFINDQIHNHIDNTYTSTAVCVNDHYTSTTVAYHCTCGWPNEARFKKWQRIQELVVSYKYIEDASLDGLDGFPNEHTANDKPLTQHVEHPLVAETIYTPAYTCIKCDANIRYIGQITPADVKPYTNNGIHLHDTTEYTVLVTCKNYHVTRAKVIRHCSCGWPDKSLVNDYIDTLAEMDKVPDPHQHTGNCRCMKHKLKQLPTNPLYTKPTTSDKYTPMFKPKQPTLKQLEPKQPKRLRNMLVAKDPCTKCNGLVSTVIEDTRTEVYYMPFVEDGLEHNHDSNKITGHGICVNGHTVDDIILYNMCECGWPTNTKKVTELETKLTAKYPCAACNAPITKVTETFSTLAYYRPFVDSNNKRHTHNQNIAKGDGVCVNGHFSNNIELCYKCECGWPEDTKQLDKQLEAHIHTYNTEPCCICAATTRAVDGPRNTINDTNDTIFALVKCTNGHQTSQRCAYTCGPPCYIDKLRKTFSDLRKKQISDETMWQFRPVTSSGFTSQLLHGNCLICGDNIESCTSVLQTNTLYTPYVDTNGIIHNHDCNTVSGVFTCVNKHTTTQQLSAKCSCGWVRSVPFTTRLNQLINKLKPRKSTLLDAIDAGLKL